MLSKTLIFYSAIVTILPLLLGGCQDDSSIRVQEIPKKRVVSPRLKSPEPLPVSPHSSPDNLSNNLSNNSPQKPELPEGHPSGQGDHFNFNREKLTYDQPAGWNFTPAEGMRIATIKMDNFSTLLGVISSMEGSGGSTEGKLSMWRNSLALPSIPFENGDSLFTTFVLNSDKGQSGRWLFLQGGGDNPEGLWVAEIPQSNQTVFIKFTGKYQDLKTLEGQFIAFSQSFSFKKTESGEGK